jgi:hypothetical protein
MKLFRVFRRHGWTNNFNAYRVMNEELTELSEKLNPEGFKQYLSTLNCHSSLREMYDMARHVGDFSWLPEFAEKGWRHLLCHSQTFISRELKV